MPLNKRPATMSTRQTEAGNAFFIVLIGVVLFTALMFTFSRGAQQGGGNIANRRADLSATEILDYASKHDRAINRLLSRSCSESELNFENSTITNSDNATAPSDGHCDVFAPNGGGISFTTIPPQWLDNDHSDKDGYGLPVFGGDARMLEIGSDAATNQDLILWIGFVSADVCAAINKKLGIDPMPTFVDGPYAGLYYTGSFNDTWQAELSEPGLKAACASETNSDNAFADDANAPSANQSIAGSYHFYHVLIAR
ncbi:hypothetical protein [Micavibrio aeruginosavorus]|uniref:hypothetical protein n=1 Tax=Micavibrio aeruginosavorus TaxID=349221 RepID=UPI003F4ADCA7